MVIWTVTPQTYTQTGGLAFEYVASGQVSLPAGSTYTNTHYLWWAYDFNQDPIDGHQTWSYPVNQTPLEVNQILSFPTNSNLAESAQWWNNTDLPLVGENGNLGLEDLMFLQLSSSQVAKDYYLIFPEIDPTVFETDYVFPFTSFVITDDFDPTDLSTISQFLKPEYASLPVASTDLYLEEAESQINELLYINLEETCCECELPDSSCTTPISVPEASPVLGLLLIALLGITKLFKKSY
ncbi:MAG: hypothetical protein AAGG51_14685 [Cyanobacteria bacterium P01_G01_bin.54]